MIFSRVLSGLFIIVFIRLESLNLNFSYCSELNGCSDKANGGDFGLLNPMGIYMVICNRFGPLKFFMDF